MPPVFAKRCAAAHGRKDFGAPRAGDGFLSAILLYFFRRKRRGKIRLGGGMQMHWFNGFGLVFMLVIMVPNVVFAIRCRDGFENKWKNKPVELMEQIGRFGCFGFMVFSIPGVCFGWPSDEAFALHLIGNAVLTAAYCAVWAVCFRKNSVFRALALSILPSVLFLFSGITSRSVPLVVSALLFAPSHIAISCRNAS